MNQPIKKEENINTWLTEINSEAKAAISVDCVIFGYDAHSLKVLSIKCNMPPHNGKLSLIGDVLRGNETLDEAASRIIKERTGLSNLYFEQVEAFGDPGRHPLGRVITISYYSLILINEHQLIDDQNKDLKWVSVNNIEEMAFDHMRILNTSYERLKKRMQDHPLGFSLLPKKFTLIQLQRLYEIILGVKLDKRNFRRKLNTLGLLKDLNENQKDVSHRPAKLYSLDQEKLKDQNIKFGL